MKTIFIVSILGLFSAGLSAANLKHYSLQGEVVDVVNGTSFEAVVEIQNERIKAVHTDELPEGVPKPSIQGVRIYPGLIDNHNHLKYNVMPLWVPASADKFDNRNQWPKLKEYKKGVKKVFGAIYSKPKECDKFKKGSKEKDDCLIRYKCDALIYGELKALASGVTSLQGSTAYSHSSADMTHSGLTKYDKSDADWRSPLEEKLTACIDGAVRNTERDTFGADKNRVRTTAVGIDSEKPWKLKKGAASLLAEMQTGDTQAFFIHLSEGIDQVSKDEFKLLDNYKLLRPEMVIIHGTALGAPEFERMGDNNMSLVWSPTSNLLLYEKTTDVLSAMSSGVNLTLGSDWSLSGTKGLLGELKIADWALTSLNGGQAIKDQAIKLVQMATINAAKSLNLEENLGSVEAGKLADLLILMPYSSGTDPFTSLVNAQESAVELVIVGGAPVYGNPHSLRKLSPKTTFSPVPESVCGAEKAFNLNTKRLFRYKALKNTLDERLEAAYKALKPDMQAAIGEAFSKTDPLCEHSDPRFNSLIQELKDSTQF